MKTSLLLKAAVIAAFALAYHSNVAAQDGGRMHEGGATQMTQKFTDENGDGLNDHMQHMSSEQTRNQQNKMHGSGMMNNQNGMKMHNSGSGMNHQGGMGGCGSMNSSNGMGNGHSKSGGMGRH